MESFVEGLWFGLKENLSSDVVGLVKIHLGREGNKIWGLKSTLGVSGAQLRGAVYIGTITALLIISIF